MLRYLTFALAATTTYAADTLVIGDSYAEYGQQYWSSYCGVSITNEGQGGSTSVAWASGTTMEDALAADPAATKFIFLIGGNDFMGGRCAMTRSEVKAVVTQSLSKLVGLVQAAGKTASDITMLGYPVPTATFTTGNGECPGSTAATLDTLNGGISDACADLGVGYLDMSYVAGAPQNPIGWSPGLLHADQVHLNQKGYCALANADTFRAKFSCTVAKNESCAGTGTATGAAAPLSASFMTTLLIPVLLAAAAAQ